jgi:hypothetical protein
MHSRFSSQEGNHLWLSSICTADESGKYAKNPIISLTGVGAYRGRIDRFESDWESLLQSYELHEFHMSRIADLNQACGCYMPSGQTFEERMAALIPFADCINTHLEVGLAQAWDVRGYAHLTLEAKKLLGGHNDPYFLMNVRAFQEVVEHVTSTNKDNRVSVIADDDLATAWDLYLHYREVKAAEPTLSKAMVGLTFANSYQFKPLQAADFVAFPARNQAKQEFGGQHNDWGPIYLYLTRALKAGESRIRWLESFVNEEKMYLMAQELNALAHEEGQAKRHGKKQGISTIQSGNGDDSSRRFESSKGSDGGGEESERREAEG